MADGLARTLVVLDEIPPTHSQPSQNLPDSPVPPAPSELTGFPPRIDRIFPSSTSKRYSKG